MLSNSTLAEDALTVLLASPDSRLLLELQRTFNALGLRVQAVSNGDTAIQVLQSAEFTRARGIVLLDVRLAEVASGRLLATMDQIGIRRRCPIALIADQVSDEWIARLREGVIDDIVARNTGIDGWKTHIHFMQRGHALYCELQQLRETARLEIQHDCVTGLFNRDTMLSLLFRETDRVQRLHGTLSLVLLGLDSFAKWNHRLGSEACDFLLREIAARTGRLLRSYDLLGRSGSDDFLLALPGCSTINAMMLAERLRMDVFGEPFTLRDDSGELVQARLSACYAVVSSRGRSPIVVLREAEQTLAHARLTGPDSMRCAGESPLPSAPGAVPWLFPEVEMQLR